MSKIVLELVKVMRLQHKESEALPPTASLELSATHTKNNIESGNIVPSSFVSQHITHTCNPFFNDKVDLELVPEATCTKAKGVNFPRLGSQQRQYEREKVKEEIDSRNNSTSIAIEREMTLQNSTPYLNCHITVYDNNKPTAATEDTPAKPIYHTCFQIPTDVSLGWTQKKAGYLTGTYNLFEVVDPVEHAKRAEDRYLPLDELFIAQCAAVDPDEGSACASPSSPADGRDTPPPPKPPILIIRYRVTPPVVGKVEVDRHPDVMMTKEPPLTSKYTLVPENSQYVWYNLLIDRNWQMQFSRAVLKEWPTLPKIPPLGSSPSPRRTTVSPPKSITGGLLPKIRQSRTPSTNPSPCRMRVPAVPPSYRSLTELMMKHWSVKRSHEILTRLRLAAEKFHRKKGSVAFTKDEEIEHKLLWRERQLVCLTTTLQTLEPITSTDKVRILLDKMWLNMVYGVPADNPNPPPVTVEMKQKLDTIPFTLNNATILQACLLHHLIPAKGLSFDAAMEIATDDFDPKNVTYASYHSSMQGGEFVSSEAVMMAFGEPVEPCLPPPETPVAPLDQIEEVMNATEQTAQNMLGETPSTRTAAQERASLRERRRKQDHGVEEMSAREKEMQFLKEEAAERKNIEDGPKKRTPQALFLTVLINFVGRLLDTLTVHEFEVILLCFVPAVTAASLKCLMVVSGIPSTKKKKKMSLSTEGKKARMPQKRDINGVIKIEYLDALGRLKQKRNMHHDGVATATGGNTEESKKSQGKDGESDTNQNTVGGRIDGEEDLFGMLDQRETIFEGEFAADDFSSLINAVEHPDEK